MGTGGRIDARSPSSSLVLVTWPDYDVDAHDLGGALRRAGLAARLAPKHGHRSPAELTVLAQGIAGAIVSTDPFDADVLSASRDLRIIARVGVGVDSIDLYAATAHGVMVTTTPGANEDTVADHTLALMLAVLRRITEHDAGVRRGEWNRTGRHTPRALYGATVGLVGYGHIGRRVGERLRGFRVRLLVADPLPVDDASVEVVDLESLIVRSDVISLHAPLTPETRRIIGTRQLSLMQPHAVLVNTARGGLVDEEALLDALRVGRIAGAALDVFEREPPGSSKLVTLPNVVVSPHIAGLSNASVMEMTRRATASVVDALSGRIPTDLVNPEVVAVRTR
jgi:phosphoglycerate dehydrogenase-like enzyme